VDWWLRNCEQLFSGWRERCNLLKWFDYASSCTHSLDIWVANQSLLCDKWTSRMMNGRAGCAGLTFVTSLLRCDKRTSIQSVWLCGKFVGVLHHFAPSRWLYVVMVTNSMQDWRLIGFQSNQTCWSSLSDDPVHIISSSCLEIHWEMQRPLYFSSSCNILIKFCSSSVNDILHLMQCHFTSCAIFVTTMASITGSAAN